LKKKKNTRLLNTIQTCKKHKGPLTPDSLYLLSTLSEKELLAEVTYLRLTVAPDIRQQRRVKDGAGKFRTQKFSLTELHNSIKNAIKPDESVQDNINELLLAALV